MKDQLSTLMDGEFDTESVEHVITSVKSGGELRSCWTRYHLIGDVIRGEVGRGGVQLSQDFSRRVMRALEAEPTLLAPNGQNQAQISSKQSSYKTSSYNTPRFWSVAASVAAVMFVGVMVLQQQLSQPEALSPVEIAQSVPTEYLQAHQVAAPNNAAYYIQAANYTEPKK
jgi:sigma-E factor negative regulatory protein RseA